MDDRDDPVVGFEAAQFQCSTGVEQRCRGPERGQAECRRPEQDVLDCGRDGIAVFVVKGGVFVRRAPHDERCRRAGVLGQRLEALALITDAAFGHVVDERLAEAKPGITGDRRELPRPGLLVVRCPRAQLAQLIDQVGGDLALSIDEQVCATRPDQVGKVVERERHGDQDVRRLPRSTPRHHPILR